MKILFVLVICTLMVIFSVTSAFAQASADDDDPIPVFKFYGLICKDSSTMAEYSSHANWRDGKPDKIYAENNWGTINLYSSHANWRDGKPDKIYACTY